MRVGYDYYAPSIAHANEWAQRVGVADRGRFEGFTRFRRATQTPFNLVYEAQP